MGDLSRAGNTTLSSPLLSRGRRPLLNRAATPASPGPAAGWAFAADIHVPPSHVPPSHVRTPAARHPLPPPAQPAELSESSVPAAASQHGREGVGPVDSRPGAGPFHVAAAATKEILAAAVAALYPDSPPPPPPKSAAPAAGAAGAAAGGKAGPTRMLQPPAGGGSGGGDVLGMLGLSGGTRREGGSRGRVPPARPQGAGRGAQGVQEHAPGWAGGTPRGSGRGGGGGGGTGPGGGGGTGPGGGGSGHARRWPLQGSDPDSEGSGGSRGRGTIWDDGNEVVT